MRTERITTSSRLKLQIVVVVVVAGILAALAIPSVARALQRCTQYTDIAYVRQLGTTFFAYASDRDDQEYPHGATSTEIFKELLRSGYLTNTDVLAPPIRPEKSEWFWLTGAYQEVSMPKRKSRYEGGNPTADLTGANNGWAVTQINPTHGVSLSDENNTPLIFTSGTYKVIWPTKAGEGGALVLPPRMLQGGIVVYYKGNTCRYLEKASVDNVSSTDPRFSGTTAQFIPVGWIPGPVPYQVVQP